MNRKEKEAYDRESDDVLNAASRKLFAGVPDAVRIIEESIRSSDPCLRMKAAFALLEGLGFLGKIGDEWTERQMEGID